MSIEKSRSQVIASIWQAVAQSGVDISFLQKEQQDKLVNQIADTVMVTMDQLMLDKSAEEETPDVDEEFGETILWQGHPFLSMVERYIVTNERIKLVRGMVSRNVENFELIRIQDIDMKQGINERVMGIGDIKIKGHDPSDPEIILRNVHKPEEVYEILRKAWLDARKRHGLQFSEFM